VKAAPVTPAEPPLHLAPLADLVASGGLHWLVDARPRSIFSESALIPALSLVLPEAELDAMARARGGVDLRAADELVVAAYGGSTLFLAHQVVDPAKVEAAFTARVADVEGRAIDRNGTDPRGTLVRAWGGLGKSHEAVVVFGHEAAGLALGGDAPLRAAELFAEEKLKRAQPAWRAEPLDRIAALLGEAPLRAAAPGPFDGPWRLGLGGLLAAATGAGFAARVDGDAVRVNVVVTGAWGDRATEAEAHLRDCYATLAHSGLGLLLGLSQPVSGPTFSATADSLRAEARLRIAPLVQGLADATTSEVEDIMRPREKGAPP
jgi:hypothetical protein